MENYVWDDELVLGHFNVDRHCKVNATYDVIAELITWDGPRFLIGHEVRAVQSPAVEVDKTLVNFTRPCLHVLLQVRRSLAVEQVIAVRKANRLAVRLQCRARLGKEVFSVNDSWVWINVLHDVLLELEEIIGPLQRPGVKEIVTDQVKIWWYLLSEHRHDSFSVRSEQPRRVSYKEGVLKTYWNVRPEAGFR